ncbi:MAG: RidA family protein [Candidatus Heimdallarchaeota archaeon]
MTRFKAYSSPDGPPAIGPYSAVVAVDTPSRILFIAGQGPMTADGKIVEGEIQKQTKATLKNLSLQLEAAGASLQNVAKTTVFLKDMNDFKAMNQIYAEFFKKNEVKPARSTVQAARLPMDILIEIEAIAVL